MDINAAIRGTVRGNTIELEKDSGLLDGQRVTVVLTPVDKPHFPGEGLAKSFGAWADDAEELDKYLEWNRQQRKISRAAIED